MIVSALSKLAGEKPTATDTRRVCEDSWLTPDLVDRARIRRVDDAEGRELVGRNGKAGEYQGLAFPYFVPGQNAVREYRIRRDNPDLELRDGSTRKRGKYLAPPGRGNMLYFVPGTPPDALANVNLPVTLVEGEKKTLALHRLARWGTEAPRWLPVGISGVWSWRGTVGKTNGPNGERRDVKGAISDLGRVVWEERLVYICFDSDVLTNTSVQAARRQLANELRMRGARVRLVTLADRGGTKVGIDDFLVSDGPEAALALFESATDTGNPDLLRLPYTDAGNAERLVLMHGKDLRYCTELKCWVVWDGRCWVRDTVGQVNRWAVDTMREMFRQAASITDESERKSAEKHARRSEQTRAVRDMLTATQCQDRISVSVLEFDQQPYLLNCFNGTVDLTTGILRPHRRGDLLLKHCPHPYDPSAKCPKFVKFLEQAMGDHAEASAARVEAAHVRFEFLQKAAGMSLTGDVSEKVVICCFGPKDAGKTTFLNAVRYALGEDYSGQVLIESLMANTRQSDNNSKADLAELLGKRFVTTSEAESSQRLAEGRLKYLTQGAYSKVKAARKYENPIEFDATHTLWLDANERPQIRSTDSSVWDRLKPVPFEFPVGPDEIDKQLPQKLRAEASGILACLVQGSLRWQREGLGETPDVAEARRLWREECDPLKEFIADECELSLGDPEAFVYAGALRARYDEWCNESGEKALSRRVLAKRLRTLGCREGKRYDDDGKQQRIWEGIRLARHKT